MIFHLTFLEIQIIFWLKIKFNKKSKKMKTDDLHENFKNSAACINTNARRSVSPFTHVSSETRNIPM